MPVGGSGSGRIGDAGPSRTEYRSGEAERQAQVLGQGQQDRTLEESLQSLTLRAAQDFEDLIGHVADGTANPDQKRLFGHKAQWNKPFQDVVKDQESALRRSAPEQSQRLRLAVQQLTNFNPTTFFSEPEHDIHNKNRQALEQIGQFILEDVQRGRPISAQRPEGLTGPATPRPPRSFLGERDRNLIQLICEERAGEHQKQAFFDRFNKSRNFQSGVLDTFKRYTECCDVNIVANGVRLLIALEAKNPDLVSLFPLNENVSRLKTALTWHSMGAAVRMGVSESVPAAFVASYRGGQNVTRALLPDPPIPGAAAPFRPSAGPQARGSQPPSPPTAAPASPSPSPSASAASADPGQGTTRTSGTSGNRQRFSRETNQAFRGMFDRRRRGG